MGPSEVVVQLSTKYFWRSFMSTGRSGGFMALMVQNILAWVRAYLSAARQRRCRPRERVGVPRDMSYPAARCLRATLNWVSDALE